MGRVALVTGSSRGIGRAIAERLGADGGSVVVNYRSDAGAAAGVVETIERAGGHAVAAAADVADPDQLRALFDVAEERFGGLDTVVSNVGTARFAPIAEATDADFEHVVATNLRAGFVALREAANRLPDGGRVVVISSGVTRMSLPGAGVYAATKAAVEQLVFYLARELGPRQITVNSVLPGATRTDTFASRPPWVDELVANTPLRRVGEPSDIADIVAFLASDEGRWVTGQSIAAGGGMF